MISGSEQDRPDDRLDCTSAEYERARNLLRSDHWEEGVETIERLAHNGSVLSMLLVADAMRQGGWIYDEDLNGAQEWYELAAQAGSGRALAGLGLTKIKLKDFEGAMKFLEQAVQMNYIPAHYALADIHFRGDAGQRDKGLAREHWTRAANLGHLPSRAALVGWKLRGHYGLSGFFEGLLDLVPTSVELLRTRKNDPFSDRLR